MSGQRGRKPDFLDQLIAPEAQLERRPERKGVGREPARNKSEEEKAPPKKKTSLLAPVWPEIVEGYLRKNWWPQYGIGTRHTWDDLCTAGERVVQRIIHSDLGRLTEGEDEIFRGFMEEVVAVRDRLDDETPVLSVVNGAQYTVFRAAPPMRKLEDMGVGAQIAEARARGERIPEDVVTAVRFMGEMFGRRTHAVSQWIRYGRRVYVIDPDTYELLARTDLPNVPASFLAFPLPAFYIRVPEETFHILRDDGGRDAIEGVMVNLDTTDPDVPLRTLTLSLGIAEERMGSIQSALRGTVRFTSDMPIPELARRITGALMDMYDGETPVDSVAPTVLGLCLYLASSHPNLEPVPAPAGRKGRRARGRINTQRDTTNVSRLGYIRVRRPEDAGAYVAERGERRALSQQVWVRGHWRHQAHGPRHALRRWTWIAPYIKGPDFAESMHARLGRVQAAREI